MRDGRRERAGQGARQRRDRPARQPRSTTCPRSASSWKSQRKAMVSDIAHELRTPLTNIRGWLEAAEDGVVAAGPGADRPRCWRRPSCSSTSSTTCRTSPPPTRARCACTRSRRRRATCWPRSPRRTGPADGSADGLRPALPELTADPIRLRQAVGNLVVQRDPAHPGRRPGRPRRRDRTATTWSSRSPTPAPGSTPEDLPQVFDRFWRAEKSRSRRTGGSGLGPGDRAQARRGARRHRDGGFSDPAQGSTFTLRLPSGASGRE